jgi:hypothetical protein
MSYLGKAPGAPGGVRTVYEFVATAGQTTFSGADRNGAILSYEPGFCDVFVGGVLLSQVDATDTNGTSIVVGTALTVGKIVTIVAYGTFKVADALPISGGTMQGVLSLFGGDIGVTAPQFDNDTSLATTAFVQRALGNFSGYAAYVAGGTPVLTAADAGKHIVLSGVTAGTLRLPALSTLVDGASFIVKCESNAAWSVGAAVADGAAIVGTGGGTVSTLPILIDNFALFVKSGTVWRTYGTAVGFSSSLAGNGYQKLPSGLIIQWFSATAGAQSGYDNAFPIAFTSTYYHAVAMHVGSDYSVNIVLDGTQPNPATTIRLRSSYPGNVSCTCIAVGK